MKENHTKLNKSAREKAEVALKSLLEVCQIYHLPMLASIVFENNDKETIYDNIVYSAQSHQVNLYDDQIRKHILIANGFEITSPKMDKECFIPNDEQNGDEKKKRIPTIYELDEDGKKELQIALDNLKSFSETNQTSIFASVAIANKDGKTNFSTCYNITENQLNLKNDKIHKHIMVSEKGFNVVPARDAVSIDMGEVFGDYGE